MVPSSYDCCSLPVLGLLLEAVLTLRTNVPLDRYLRNQVKKCSPPIFKPSFRIFRQTFTLTMDHYTCTERCEGPLRILKRIEVRRISTDASPFSPFAADHVGDCGSYFTKSLSATTNTSQPTASHGDSQSARCSPTTPCTCSSPTSRQTWEPGRVLWKVQGSGFQ